MKKLLGFTRSVDLLDHSGTLFKYEIETQKACKPLSAHISPFALNPKWDYTFSELQSENITDFHNHLEVGGPKIFDEIVLEIVDVCGRIALEQVSSDRETVLKAYSRPRSLERLPLPSALDETWAIYRLLQIHLIAAHEYMDSFQDGQFCIREDRKAHNQIDFRVLIAACLAGVVATRDKMIKRYFNTLCPRGVLFWLDR